MPVAAQDDLDGSEELAAPEEEPVIEEDGIPTEGMTPSQPATGEIGEPDADLGAGWGETISEGQEALPSFKKTAVDDTTTVYLVRPEIDRFRQVEDFTVSVKGERPLDSIIAEYGFSAEEGKSAAEAAKRLIGIEALAERSVVGLRGYRPDSKGSRLRLVQVSINSPDKKYLGTIALADDGTFVSGADPWINEDLSQYADGQTEVAQPQSYRLLDAIYSTATRNNVPSSVTGEAIMLISRAFDLQALATKDDRLVLAFAKTGRDESGTSGRVLYVAVHGVDRDFECFVYQPQPGAEYSCMSEKDATHSLTVTNGMVTPVNGVLTSTFGPRMHPILQRRAAAQGRRLARARRHADHGRVRRHDRVRRRRQGLRQCDPHRAWRRQGDGLCPYEPLRAGHHGRRRREGRRHDRLCRHDRALDRPASAFRDLPEWRRGRPARQRGCRRGPAAEDRLRRGDRLCRGIRRLGGRIARQPDHPCRKRWQRAGEESAIRRQPALASSSSRPGCA